MKQVHDISNGGDGSSVDINNSGGERRLKQITSSNIGQVGTLNKNSKAAELQKMIKENKKNSEKLDKK